MTIMHTQCIHSFPTFSLHSFLKCFNFNICILFWHIWMNEEIKNKKHPLWTTNHSILTHGSWWMLVTSCILHSCILSEKQFNFKYCKLHLHNWNHEDSCIKFNNCFYLLFNLHETAMLHVNLLQNMLDHISSVSNT